MPSPEPNPRPLAVAPSAGRRPASPEPFHLIPGLVELWRETLGEPAIRIAVLDGPVDAAHPCFTGHAIGLSRRRSAPMPRLELPARQNRGRIPSAHGTHVASLLFARHDCGVRGLAPRCSGIVLPVFRQTSSGALFPCTQIDLARSIGRAIDAGAHILNISGGELSPSGRANEFLKKMVRQAKKANVLIVSAVGNDGCECLHVPAALPGVLAVGAHDGENRPLDSSNWGERLSRQGVMAPGHEILGALPGGRLGRMTGSSFATPLVSGVIALLLSLQRLRGQRPDPQAVAKALVQSADPCDPRQTIDCRRLLAGRVNISAARSLLGLGPSPAPGSQVAVHSVQPSGGARNSARRPLRGPIPPSAPGVMPQHGNAASTGGDSHPGSELVFALGEIDYDFGHEARLDYFAQRLGSTARAMDPMRMAAYLGGAKNDGNLSRPHPEDANALIWTLQIDATPVYAVLPGDQFAKRAYDLLTSFLVDQYSTPKGDIRGPRPAPRDRGASRPDRLYRVAVAGRLGGTATLYNGTVVPVIRPVTRGLFNWDGDALLDAALGPGADREETVRSAALLGFLQRIYFELRNLGQTSAERALNFAGTNAYNSHQVFRAAWHEGLEGLEAFKVEPSSICRPGSDCWDVEMTFFDPKNPYRRARRVFRHTIDVSDVLPVPVGALRSWPVYSRLRR